MAEPIERKPVDVPNELLGGQLAKAIEEFPAKVAEQVQAVERAYAVGKTVGQAEGAIGGLVAALVLTLVLKLLRR